MSADSCSRAKHGLFHEGLPSIPPDDAIALSQIDPTLRRPRGSLDQDNEQGEQDLTGQDNNIGKQEVRNDPYFLCYFLHIFLITIHLVLAVLAYYHPEHRIIVSSASEAFTIGLAGGLQAFYTLYTTLLVFVTQRLMLSTVFFGPTKLTQIHDICGAWCGLGAALSALWQQTKVTSSIFSIALVTAYYIGVSVLHVASSTIMEFQPFNANVTRMVSAVAPWPNPISGFISSSWQLETPALSLVPHIQNFYGNTAQGLANNTLYDVPVSSFVNAAVNATTINSHCGLLTNLSFDDHLKNINVSMTGLDPFSFGDFIPPLPNEVWFTIPDDAAQPFITYLVSAAIEVEGSVNGTSYVYINGTFSPPGVTAQNFTTKVYLIACTVDATNTKAILETSESGVRLHSLVGEQPSSASASWTTFFPGGDVNITSAILSAMTDGTRNHLVPMSPYCQPVMSEPYWLDMTIFDIYLISLGINITSLCDGKPVEQYTGPPYLLTRVNVESSISNLVARFVWIAGQFGKAGGGFDRKTEDAQITEYILRWRLNINLLPVISSLCASVVLCILVVCMLWRRNNQKVVIHTAGPLEIMWFGSRSAALRAYLGGLRSPSVDSLRTVSISKTILWTQTLFVHPDQNGSCQCGNLHTAFPYDRETHQTFKTFENGLCPGNNLSPARFIVPSEYAENLQPISHPGLSHRTRNVSRGRRWCYVLHIVLVSLHVSLLLLLVPHPEHHVIISLETTTLTIGLSALLQATYTLYSALLVFILQCLAFSRMIGERRRLTAIHDVSGAWTGIGAAMVILWQQRQLVSSPREVLTVAVYLISMLVLHIASSSIMRWQAFNNPLPVLQSNLAVPDSAVNISQLDWSDASIIAFAFPQLGDQFTSSLSGLSNSTIYDVPQIPGNVTVSEVIVNATTFSTQCGLVPNLTLLSDQFEYSGSNNIGEYRIGFSLNGSGNNTLLAPPIWKDLLLRIDGQCADCPQMLFYMITAMIDVDESVNDPVALELNWTYTTSPGANPQNSTTVTYIAACSINTSTTPVVLNLTEQKLVSTPNQTVNNSSTSTSWSVWPGSPVAATSLDIEMVTVLSLFNVTDGGNVGNSSNPYTSTFMDDYLMSLVGWNLPDLAFSTQSSANPSMTLTPAQLENAISQTAATFLWVAGQLGESNGGFSRVVGRASQVVVQYRLNINTIPVIFASTASFVALVVAILILGRKPSQASISVSGMSVLESLWLEANSEELHSRLEAIKEPDIGKLREAGMFDVCLGDVRTRTGRLLQTSESEELPLIENSENDIHDGMGEQP